MNKKQKHAHIVIRCTDKEHEEIKTGAWKERMSMNAWILKVLKRTLGIK